MLICRVMYLLEFKFIRKFNTMTILNIVDCVPRVHHVSRKLNTIHMDKRIIMMTDDIHLPVTSAAL